MISTPPSISEYETQLRHLCIDMACDLIGFCSFKPSEELVNQCAQAIFSSIRCTIEQNPNWFMQSKTLLRIELIERSVTRGSDLPISRPIALLSELTRSQFEKAAENGWKDLPNFALLPQNLTLEIVVTRTGAFVGEIFGTACPGWHFSKIEESDVSLSSIYLKRAAR